MRINEISVADHPDAWRAAGFTVVDDAVTIGNSFVIRLTGAGDGGVTGWSLGIDGTKEPGTHTPGGLALQVQAPAAPDPGTAQNVHENGVVTAMKAVILTADTTTSIKRLQEAAPGIGSPSTEGHGANGAHYAIWALDDTEVGLEVVCLDANQGNDAMAALFLVVDNLDASITRIGANDVSPIEIYGGRQKVMIKPRIGVTAGIQLIAPAGA